MIVEQRGEHPRHEPEPQREGVRDAQLPLRVTGVGERRCSPRPAWRAAHTCASRTSTLPVAQHPHPRPDCSISATPSLRSSVRIARCTVATLTPNSAAVWPKCSVRANATSISRSVRVTSAGRHVIHDRRRLQREPDVGEQVIGVLDAQRDPGETLGDRVAPAGPPVDRRVDAAEAGGGDQQRAALDQRGAPRRRRPIRSDTRPPKRFICAAGDVVRRIVGQPRVAHRPHRGMVAQHAGDGQRVVALPLETQTGAAEAAQATTTPRTGRGSAPASSRLALDRRHQVGVAARDVARHAGHCARTAPWSRSPPRGRRPAKGVAGQAVSASCCRRRGWRRGCGRSSPTDADRRRPASG